MDLVVPQPCPSPATNVLAEAFGHGFPASGQPVINNSTSGVSHTAPFVLPLQDTFTGFAADNATSLSGPYRITLRCISRLRTKTFASFSATVTFSDPKHYTAPAPPASVIQAINASQNPGGAAPGASGAAPSAGAGSANGKSGSTGSSGQAGKSGGAASPGNAAPSASASSSGNGSSAGAATGGSSSATPETQKAAASHHSSDSIWQPLLIAGSLLLIALGVLLRIREVRSTRGRGERRTRGRPKSPDSNPINLVDPPDSSEPTSPLAGSSGNNAKGRKS
jgi:hypothetical protein